MSRSALLCFAAGRLSRTASARITRLRKNAASTSSWGSNVQTRARICDAGLYAARAITCPDAERTSTVSPTCGLPLTRSTAPEKIHGWRRRSDFSRLGADRHGAGLGAFARDRHFALPQIEPSVADVERNELRQAQARGVQKLEHRAVAQRGRRRLVRRVEQALGGFHRQRLRQRPRRLRRADAEHRVGAETAVPREPAEPAAPRAEDQRERARRQALGVQQRDRASHLGRLERLERFALAEGEQDIQGARVIRERRRREAPLVLQRVEILARELWSHYSRAVTPAAQSSPMRRR